MGKIIGFEYEKLLLLKAPLNNAASTIAITETKNKEISETYHHIPVAFWDKITDFADAPKKNFIKWCW